MGGRLKETIGEANLHISDNKANDDVEEVDAAPGERCLSLVLLRPRVGYQER